MKAALKRHSSDFVRCRSLMDAAFVTCVIVGVARGRFGAAA
jgi:hypothetical protein